MNTCKGVMSGMQIVISSIIFEPAKTRNNYASFYVTECFSDNENVPPILSFFLRKRNRTSDHKVASHSDVGMQKGQEFM